MRLQRVHKYPTNHFRVSPAMQMIPAQMDSNKTNKQLDEERKNFLAIRIQPLDLTGLEWRAKAPELWEINVKLETEKFELEERQLSLAVKIRQ